MSYAERKDGQGWRSVSSADDCTAGEVFSVTQPVPPTPTAEEQISKAVNAVKFALQSAIDAKASAAGFSSGNALMLYAGFTNPFKAIAIVFAQWEASVWLQAETYKVQVLAGKAPMLTPAEAVAMMPVYPV